MSLAYVDRSPSRVSSAMPPPVTTIPTTTSGRGPTRAKRSVLVVVDVRMVAATIGRNVDTGLDRAVAEDPLQVEGQQQDHPDSPMPVTRIAM